VCIPSRLSTTANSPVLITGPTPSTLGAATALALATGNPAHLLLAGRALSKLQPLLDTLNATVKATFIPLDLSSLDSVRHAASEVSTLLGPGELDILINNAGIMARPNYSTTVDGIESQFGVNHIGHFLFTNLLLSSGTLSRTGGRVVNLTSNAAEIGPVRFEDWNFGDGKEYHPWKAYGQSKSANILFAKGLASRGVKAFSVHPGGKYLPRTGLRALDAR
jgi:NAD(P)-dependent dehydrogenase (short-subunit alcohol dehydrogenase family)